MKMGTDWPVNRPMRSSKSRWFVFRVNASIGRFEPDARLQSFLQNL